MQIGLFEDLIFRYEEIMKNNGVNNVLSEITNCQLESLGKLCSAMEGPTLANHVQSYNYISFKIYG